MSDIIFKFSLTDGESGNSREYTASIVAGRQLRIIDEMTGGEVWVAFYAGNTEVTAYSSEQDEPVSHYVLPCDTPTEAGIPE